MRPSKRQIAYNVIKNAIINNEFKQDYILTERNLCLKVGVSRTPVREAIKKLASEGLLEVIPGTGAVITRIRYEDMIEIFELREILECAAVKFFIERKTEDSISALRKAYYEQLEVYKQKDPYVFMEKDRQFHLEIIKGAKHKRMEEIMGILNNQIKMLAIRIRNDNYVLDFSIIDHQRILEAIEKNDVETATESLRQHIRKVKNYNESKYFLLKKP